MTLHPLLKKSLFWLSITLVGINLACFSYYLILEKEHEKLVDLYIDDLQSGCESQIPFSNYYDLYIYDNKDIFSIKVDPPPLAYFTETYSQHHTTPTIVYIYGIYAGTNTFFSQDEQNGYRLSDYDGDGLPDQYKKIILHDDSRDEYSWDVELINGEWNFSNPQHKNIKYAEEQ